MGSGCGEGPSPLIGYTGIRPPHPLLGGGRWRFALPCVVRHSGLISSCVSELVGWSYRGPFHSLPGLPFPSHVGLVSGIHPCSSHPICHCHSDVGGRWLLGRSTCVCALEPKAPAVRGSSALQSGGIHFSRVTSGSPEVQNTHPFPNVPSEINMSPEMHVEKGPLGQHHGGTLPSGFFSLRTVLPGYMLHGASLSVFKRCFPNVLGRRNILFVSA